MQGGAEGAFQHRYSQVALPQGSKDPNGGVLGPKHYNMNGIWDLKPYYLGPWTLRVMYTQNADQKPDVNPPAVRVPFWGSP